MRPAVISLRNWMSYRGEVVLELGAKAYGIVARKADNPDRSNFLGKSALLEAVDFALHGRLNPDRHAGADGWISDGEKDGHVEIVFDDGKVLRRSRKTGKSTQLTYGGAKGDEAQRLLAERMGLTADDALSTWYFRQRQMAQFVLNRERRAETVVAWLQLAPLEAAEDNVRAATSAAAFEAETIRQSLAECDAVEREAFNTDGGTLEGLQAQAKAVAAELEAAKAAQREADEARAGAMQREADERLVLEFDAIANEGKKLHAELKAQPPEALAEALAEAQAWWDEVQAELATAGRDEAQKRLLARGAFDGVCPVAGIACPAKKEINAATDRNAKLHAEARAKLEAIEVQPASAALSEARAASEARARKAERFDLLKQRGFQLRAHYEQAKARLAMPKPPAPEAAADAVYEAQAKLASIQRSIQLVMAANAERVRLAAQLEAAERKLAAHRAALAVVGKQGAQRRVAEGALSRMNDDANAVLSALGVDIGVELVWSREGSGLAKACDACGHPFPASARVKACERCGAARGPNLVNRLEVMLTEQSGAAEDLAGAAIQLAASAWLRRRRGAAWAMAMIDEPVGQLDAAHRRAFSAHLAGMLAGRYGFEQALVVAHHASVVDSLPGRIEVVGEAGRSTARVIA